AAALLLAAAILPGIAFAVVVVARADPKLVATYYRHPALLGPDDARALAFLRRHVARDELAYRTGRAAEPYTLWRGIAGPWTTYQAGQHGFGAADRARWKQLLETLPRDPHEWTRLAVRWLVIGPEDGRLAQLADAWVADGFASEVASFGRLRIV